MISYVWICMLVFLFGVAWMILDDFGNHFLVQMKVVESLDKRAESLLMDLMKCLAA